MTSTTSTTKSPAFLSLPLEIRLDIYTLLLLLPPPTHHHPSDPPSHIHANILLTNRQINHEATPLLYSSNVFIAHPSLLTSFPRLRPWYPPLREAAALAPRQRRFHIQLRLDSDLPYGRAAVAEAFSGVRELSIRLVQSAFLGVGCANLAAFEDVRAVACVTIVGSTTGFEHYISWLKNAMQSEHGASVPKFEPPESPSWAHHILSAHADRLIPA